MAHSSIYREPLHAPLWIVKNPSFKGSPITSTITSNRGCIVARVHLHFVTPNFPRLTNMYVSAQNRLYDDGMKMANLRGSAFNLS